MIKTVIKNKNGVKNEYELIKNDEIGYYIDMWYLCFAGISVDNSLTVMRTSLVKPDEINLAQALTDIVKTKVGIHYSFIKDMLNDKNILNYTNDKSKSQNIHIVGKHKCTLVKNRYRLSFFESDHCEKLAQELSDKISKASMMGNYFIDSYFLYESIDMVMKTNIGYIISPKLDYRSLYPFFKNFYPSLETHEHAEMTFNVGTKHYHKFNDTQRYIGVEVFPNNIFMGR